MFNVEKMVEENNNISAYGPLLRLAVGVLALCGLFSFYDCTSVKKASQKVKPEVTKPVSR